MLCVSDRACVCFLSVPNVLRCLCPLVLILDCHSVPECCENASTVMRCERMMSSGDQSCQNILLTTHLEASCEPFTAARQFWSVLER